MNERTRTGMRAVARAVFRGTFYTATILLFMVVAVAGFTQTRTFRNYLQNLILASYPEAINGTLHVGSIDGNLVTGLQLTNVVLEDSLTRFISVDRIDIRYDMLGLIFQRAAISKLTLVNPDIHIYRTLHGAWNIDGITKSTPGDTSTSPWYIEAKQIDLVNARVSITDSVRLAARKQAPSPTRVDYARVQLERVNATLALQIFQKRNFIQVKKLSFESVAPQFRLVQLIGDAVISPKEVELKKFRIETARSVVFISASMGTGDFSRLSDEGYLKTVPLSLDVNALRLNAAELKQVLYPDVDFLQDELSFRVTASGSLDRMVVEQVLLQTPNTFLQVQGGMSHLLDASALTMDLFCNNNKLDPDDFERYVPGLKLPYLHDVGPIAFSMDVRGKPSDLASHLNLESDAGGVTLAATLKRERGLLSYDADIHTRSLNLARALDDPQLESSLTGTLKVNGTGTSLSTAIAIARLEVDSSAFYQLPLQHSVVVIDAAQGVLTSRIALRWNGTQLDAVGKLDTRLAASVAYEITGKVNGLDLKDVLRDAKFESDLRGTFFASGDIGSRDRVADSVEFRFGPSSFGTKSFEQGSLSARYASLGGDLHELRIVSQPVDASVKGVFTPASLIASIQHSIEGTIAAVEQKLENLDSLRSVSRKITTVVRQRSAGAPLADTVDYTLHTAWRDVSPVGLVLRVPMEGNGRLDAIVRGGAERLSVVASVAAPEFELGHVNDSLSATTLKVDIRADNISRVNAADSLALGIAATAATFKLGKNLFVDPSVTVVFALDTGTVAVKGSIDSVVSVDVAGNLRTRLRLLEIDLARFKATVGAFTFASEDRAFLTAGKDGLQITKLNLKHDQEEITASGFFSPKGISDVTASAKGVLLSKAFIQNTPLANAFNDVHGILYANGTLRGSLDHPNFAVEASVDGFRYVRSAWSEQDNKVIDFERVLGRLDSRFNYFEHNLSLFVRLVRSGENTTDKPDALISGSMPFELALANENPHSLSGSMNVQVQANKFDLQLIAPFIPVVSNLQGTLSADMKIVGAVEKPQYSGFALLEKSTFVFDPVGITYQMSGRLVPNGDRIQFENMVIRNADNASRAMSVSGTLGLFGLTLNDFDLRFDGSLEVMREDFRKPDRKFYGDLYISSGPNGLRWRGTPLQSFASGDVVVNSARLTFPPERETAGFTERKIAVKYVDDTSSVSAPAVAVSRGIPVQTATLAAVPSPSAQTTAESTTLLDRISYDMSIQVSEQTKVRFVFSTQTSEELYAVLRGRLGFFKTPTVTRVSGELAVGEQSYYYLFKKFDATGSLRFTGDPLNPELNIIATYSGIHKTDSSSAATQASTEKVNVILTITENKNAPKTKIDLDVSTIPDQKKIIRPDAESDALSFILAGKWKDELTQQQAEAASFTSYGLAAGALTGPLSSVLRERTKGYVQSVDVAYYGGGSGSFGEKADVRLTGQVGDAVIRAGGKVLNDPSRTNVSLELPVSTLVNNDRLRNLILTVERKFDERGDITGKQGGGAATNGAKLFYRIIF